MIVIFDLDGTLIDSAPDIHATANAVLADEGLGQLDLATVRGFVGRGVPHLVDRLLGAHGIADPVRAERMTANLVARYEGAVGLTAPYPGVGAVLKHLRGRGDVLGVCTNKPLAPAMAVLRHLGLDQYFDAVAGGDSGLPRKPDPAPLLDTLARLGGGTAAYVGDSEVDAESARAAGLPFLMFTEGYRSAAAETLPHHAMFSDFAELPGLLDLL
ncbi:phosphoglycolate phosphatase [Paracoccus isoporae]|uniref:Phosphoglycolate phosphatase n=1 Tax=Paracoccus isoporae TaxID=591205 RepID=A0A1G7CV41_9RHOB|nr:phosphoglycolate phosphatase [Paracoccus isoporae]SDE43314.1 phosphoglycolate phosphatase [Paracoccus isoporae]